MGFIKTLRDEFVNYKMFISDVIHIAINNFQVRQHTIKYTCIDSTFPYFANLNIGELLTVCLILQHFLCSDLEAINQSTLIYYNTY